MLFQRRQKALCLYYGVKGKVKNRPKELGLVLRFDCILAFMHVPLSLFLCLYSLQCHGYVCPLLLGHFLVSTLNP